MVRNARDLTGAFSERKAGVTTCPFTFLLASLTGTALICPTYRGEGQHSMTMMGSHSLYLPQFKNRTHGTYTDETHWKDSKHYHASWIPLPEVILCMIRLHESVEGEITSGSFLFTPLSFGELLWITCEISAQSCILRCSEKEHEVIIYFPCGPVARTLCFQCRGPGFDPWSGNQLPHATTKSSHAAVKARPSQINKNKMTLILLEAHQYSFNNENFRILELSRVVVVAHS